MRRRIRPYVKVQKSMLVFKDLSNIRRLRSRMGPAPRGVLKTLKRLGDLLARQALEAVEDMCDKQ